MITGTYAFRHPRCRHDFIFIHPFRTGLCQRTFRSIYIVRQRRVKCRTHNYIRKFIRTAYRIIIRIRISIFTNRFKLFGGKSVMKQIKYRFTIDNRCCRTGKHIIYKILHTGNKILYVLFSCTGMPSLFHQPSITNINAHFKIILFRNLLNFLQKSVRCMVYITPFHKKSVNPGSFST